MVLDVIVFNKSSGDQNHVCVDDLAAVFFDTFLAVISPSQHFQHFYYEDEDGDLIAVRTNEELAAMLSFSQYHPLKIHLISNDEPLESNLPSIVPHMLKRLCPIGSGYSSTVYKALDMEHDRIVALKCIALDVCSEHRIVAREVQLLRKYSCSPYVVNFMSAVLIDSELCLCMEFMDGGSLESYEKLPVLVLVPVTVSIICGLHYLWIHNVMHRDIKPSNILVNTRGDVKISDFGLSRQLEKSFACSYVGTSLYMAPERIRGDPYGICSDIWSFGLTICELATGTFPLAVNTQDKNISSNFLYDELNIMDSIGSEDLPVDLVNVLKNCVIVKAAKRWKHEDLISCPFIMLNVPVDLRPVAQFVCAAF
ncbi:unnamed protein product [Thelazia callipaeda]|uniref:mitogen-activated protein kinase kinase n=1 Tax=Thelazia callipaeda TaxID=103827 RepID=A0A0N5CU92_THECL|nr:unnamed protein product [Thelazia callipaeda]